MPNERPYVHFSEIVHENRWFRIRHDGITWPNGSPGDYFVLSPPVGGCLVIAEHDHQILIVEQYRHTIQGSSIEFPKGGINLNELPKEAADRELLEETGLRAGSLTQIGTVQELVGAANYPIHIFVTNDLRTGLIGAERDETEFDLTARWVPVEELRMLIRKNWIQDSATLAAWTLYQEYLQRP